MFFYLKLKMCYVLHSKYDYRDLWKQFILEIKTFLRHGLMKKTIELKKTFFCRRKTYFIFRFVFHKSRINLTLCSVFRISSEMRGSRVSCITVPHLRQYVSALRLSYTVLCVVLHVSHFIVTCLWFCVDIYPLIHYYL